MTDRTASAVAAVDVMAGGEAAPFRPIQYMGSKARLLNQIEAAIDAADPAGGPVVDLFSGSGVVAARLARRRAVTAVDIQEYARVLAAALMRPARLSSSRRKQIRERAERLARELERELDLAIQCEGDAIAALAAGDPEPFCAILEHGSLAAQRLGGERAPGPFGEVLGELARRSESRRGAMLADYYGGVYFAYRQALQIDCLLSAVRSLPEGAERNTGLAAVLGVASASVTSVGSHFAQPIRPRDASGRPKTRMLLTAARRRQLDVFAVFDRLLASYASLPGAKREAVAVRCDYRDFLASHQGPVSVIYADPPYTRDHYSRFYHVLETIARDDKPDISTVSMGDSTVLSRGLYRRDRHQSPFCIRSKVVGAFEALFARCRRFDAPLVLSYSPYTQGTVARPRTRLLTIPEVAELAAATFGSVSVRSGGRISHSKFNVSRLNGDMEREAELLLICTP